MTRTYLGWGHFCSSKKGRGEEHQRNRIPREESHRVWKTQIMSREQSWIEFPSNVSEDILQVLQIIYKTSRTYEHFL